MLEIVPNAGIIAKRGRRHCARNEVFEKLVLSILQAFESIFLRNGVHAGSTVLRQNWKFLQKPWLIDERIADAQEYVQDEQSFGTD